MGEKADIWGFPCGVPRKGQITFVKQNLSVEKNYMQETTSSKCVQE